ncbi:MAG: porin family protein [Gammaproteobacteria bacterium]|nr:porin family protein [Gammaproteobacteria bacterium]
MLDKKWIFLSLCGLYSAFANANIVSSVSGGPAWYQAGQTQTIYLQPGFNNTYVANTPTQTLASGEWFLGVQRSIHTHTFAQLGVALATSTAAHLAGHVWELADPLFDNFVYQYRILHSHAALKGKVLSDALSRTYLPYVSGSVGVAWNQAYQFSMSPIIFEAIPQPPFQTNTQTAFTYTAGAGVQKILNDHWQLGMGYEFADWGGSTLSRASAQTINNGLTLSHLYTNQLQFNITYTG